VSNTKKASSSKNHHKPDELRLDPDLHDPADDHGYAGEQAREESRQTAMGARERAMRTKMTAGQANTMRLKRGNQQRGNR
jgi:hypothetical protein